MPAFSLHNISMMLFNGVIKYSFYYGTKATTLCRGYKEYVLCLLEEIRKSSYFQSYLIVKKHQLWYAGDEGGSVKVL